MGIHAGLYWQHDSGPHDAVLTKNRLGRFFRDDGLVFIRAKSIQISNTTGLKWPGSVNKNFGCQPDINKLNISKLKTGFKTNTIEEAGFSTFRHPRSVYP